MRRGALLALTWGLSANLIACAPNPSGVYVAAADDKVAMVQLVQSDQGKVAGRIEQVTLTDEGTPSVQSLNVEGATNGNQVVLSAKGPFGGGGMAAELRPGSLVLAAAGERTMLKKANLATYQREVVKLGKRGQKIAADRGVDRVKALLAEATRSTGEVGSARLRLAEALNRIRQHNADISTAMRQAKRIEQALDPATQGIQLSQVNARAAALNAEKVRTDVAFGAIRQDVNKKLQVAADAIASAKKLCGGPAGKFSSDFLTVCQSVGAHEDDLRRTVELLRPDFAETDRSSKGRVG